MSESEILNDVKKKTDLSIHYYDNFEKHLSNNRTAKASEFAWGVINTLVYAIGLTYGKKLSSHQKTIEFAKKLSETEEDANIFKAIKAGEILHANFYHDFLDKDGLLLKKTEIDDLVNKLKKILDKRITEIRSSFVEESPTEDIF